MWRRSERAGWDPTGGSESSGGIFQQLRNPPEKCGVYTPSWAPQTTAPETAGVTESLLKGQCTKFHLQPLTLGSGRRREDRVARDT